MRLAAMGRKRTIANDNSRPETDVRLMIELGRLAKKYMAGASNRAKFAKCQIYLACMPRSLGHRRYLTIQVPPI